MIYKSVKIQNKSIKRKSSHFSRMWYRDQRIQIGRSFAKGLQTLWQLWKSQICVGDAASVMPVSKHLGQSTSCWHPKMIFFNITGIYDYMLIRHARICVLFFTVGICRHRWLHRVSLNDPSPNGHVRPPFAVLCQAPRQVWACWDECRLANHI